MKAKIVLNHRIGILIVFLMISVIHVGIGNIVAAQAPAVPDQPWGETEAELNELVAFNITTVNATDDHDVMYEFDWGDNLTTSWLGPYPSGTSGLVEVSHQWQEAGTFQVKARAMDNVTQEISNWSKPLNVTIGHSGPKFTIGEIIGGFGLSAEIVNNLASSKYVDYKVEIAGGQLTGFHTNQRYNGTVFIPSGGIGVVTVPTFFALGRTKITVTAEAAGEKAAEKVQHAFVFFFYVMMMEE